MVLVRPESSASNVGNEAGHSTVRVKEPKRILHFCDGVLEEYSTDEDENDNRNNNEQPIVDTSTLTWGPWFWYKAWAAGSTTLYAIDKTGEFFASAFGITTPRYYFELEEHKKREGERLTQKQQEKSWGANMSNTSAIMAEPVTKSEPKPVDV